MEPEAVCATWQLGAAAIPARRPGSGQEGG